MTMTSDRLTARAQAELDEEWEAQATCALKASLDIVTARERLLNEARADHLALRKAIDDHTFRPSTLTSQRQQF